MRAKVIDKNIRIAIIGGHMTPALAVLNKLQEKGFHNIVWIGQKYSQTGDTNYSSEYSLINRKAIKFIDLQTGKLWKKWTRATWKKALLNLLLIPGGFIQAAFIILKYKPKIIIGFGGYLNVPIFLQFPLIKLLRVKLYLHEQPVRPGLATRTTYRFADQVFLSWAQSRKYFSKHRHIKITGNPMEAEFLNARASKKFFANNLPILLIIGGNQGANTFNKRLRSSILEKYLETFNIVHQTGHSSITRDLELARKEAVSLPAKFKRRYQVFDFIEPEKLSRILDNTTLVLSRSGANTVQKILFKGIPTVFMPLPWSSNNEQLENAKLASKTGIAKIVEFREGLTDQGLYQEIMTAYEQTLINTSFNPRKTWKEAKTEARKLVKLNAADKILKYIITDLETM